MTAPIRQQQFAGRIKRDSPVCVPRVIFDAASVAPLEIATMAQAKIIFRQDPIINALLSLYILGNHKLFAQHYAI